MFEIQPTALLAPTSSGHTDLTAVLVTEYGPLQGHASPVISRQEVSRYHRLDSTHIRVRRVDNDNCSLTSSHEMCFHIGQLVSDSPLLEAAKIVLNK